MTPSVIKKVEFWYPLIMFSLGLCHQVVTQWAVFYYAPPPGIGAYLLVGQIGLAMVLGRIVDALADPITAYYSDRAKFRLGRRKPFILVGIPFFIISFVLLWRPPVQLVSPLNLIWALAFLAIFFFSYSIITVPYLALLPELARGEEQRIKLSALQGVLYGAGAGFGLLYSTLLGPSLGMARAFLYLSPLIAFTLLWPAILVQEKSDGLGETPSPGLISLVCSIGEDRVFLWWIGVQGLCRSAVIMVVMLLPYLGTVILRITSFEEVSIPALILVIAGSTLSTLISFRLLAWKGVDEAYRNSLATAGVAVLVLSFVGLIPLDPQFQAAFLIALAVGPLSLIMLLPNAVVAHMAQERQNLLGDRQEGLLYALQGLVIKLSVAGASALLSLLLHFGGGTFDAPAGIYLSLLAAGLMLIISFLVFRRYLALKKTLLR